MSVPTTICKHISPLKLHQIFELNSARRSTLKSFNEFYFVSYHSTVSTIHEAR
jgi:hypothetical protein